MLLAETAMRFNSEISVRRVDQDKSVDGKSIMQLMMLAAVCGTELEISANGDDAHDALTELSSLIDGKFSEDVVDGQ